MRGAAGALSVSVLCVFVFGDAAQSLSRGQPRSTASLRGDSQRSPDTWLPPKRRALSSRALSLSLKTQGPSGRTVSSARVRPGHLTNLEPISVCTSSQVPLQIQAKLDPQREKDPQISRTRDRHQHKQKRCNEPHRQETAGTDNRRADRRVQAQQTSVSPPDILIRLVPRFDLSTILVSPPGTSRDLSSLFLTTLLQHHTPRPCSARCGRLG